VREQRPQINLWSKNLAIQGFQNIDDELAVASLVDNMYRIVRLIGRGGMGAVYEAEDIRLGRSVALKVLRSDLAKQLQADERFLQEARVLARIRSPFVCTVFSIGATVGGKTYIAMEYIDGESLGDVLDRERWLDLKRCVRVGQRCCEALIEAHELGIIHRDLKPDNILLTRIGSVDDYVKVVDLGLAKHIESAGSSNNPRLTQTRLVLGTPAYMSPEQAAGHDVGPGSDLYALGVIFYEMLTGYLPVDGETPQDFLRAHQLQAPVPLSERRPDLSFPPSLEQFVQRVLSKKPGDRPASAREFLKALAPFEHMRINDERSNKPATTRSSAIPKRVATQFNPAMKVLDDRLDRAKDRVRLELVGLVSRGRGALYGALDGFSQQVRGRADMPTIVRIRVPTADRRVPLACLFDDVRSRSGVYDNDAAAVSRRKLLGWVQGLMPDRPGRANQVAHLLGMFLGVDFPDSPHLSHAQSVPEVARMAAGTALADVLRAITGRGSLVLLLERVEYLTDSECSFLRRLVRQLGATPVLVVAGWVCRTDEIPRGLSGMITPGSITRVPDADSPAPEALSDPSLRRAAMAAIRIGSPLWLGLMEAALGYDVTDDMARLTHAGILRPASGSRLTTEPEYNLGAFSEALFEESVDAQVDAEAMLAWLRERSRERTSLWAKRLAQVEAQTFDFDAAADHARLAGATAHSLGALPEAIEAYEVARGYCLGMLDRGQRSAAARRLAEVAIGLVHCLEALADDERASDRAREAIEELKIVEDLPDDDWFRLGVPLLHAWADAETRAGRGAGTITPLTQQVEALVAADGPAAEAQRPCVRRALGDALRDSGDVDQALHQWLTATAELPAEPPFSLSADLSIRVADAYRETGEGARAVSYARKALAAARHARDLIREAEALRTLALALRDVGEIDDAEAQLGEALNALGRVDRPRLAAEVSVLLAAVLKERGAIDEADAALAKACRSFAALTDLAGLADALRQRGEIQIAQGIYTRALAFAEESARQAELAHRGELQIKAHLLASRAAAASDDSHHAHNSLETAFQLLPDGIATVARGDCMVALADLIEAEVLTSDHDVVALLGDAVQVYAASGATVEAARVNRRMEAMIASANRSAAS
jgi:serine/threonine protein kinase/tetratricopeptide (TPR) repeat protein